MAHVFVSDGTQYTLQSLKVRESRRCQMILARALAPMFTESPNLAAALSSLTEADLDVLTNTFGAACTYEDPKGGDYRLDKALDLHFSGRPLAYWRWLAECVKAEYEEVFTEGRKLLTKLRPTPTATPSASPQG